MTYEERLEKIRTTESLEKMTNYKIEGRKKWMYDETTVNKKSKKRTNAFDRLLEKEYGFGLIFLAIIIIIFSAIIFSIKMYFYMDYKSCPFDRDDYISEEAYEDGLEFWKKNHDLSFTEYYYELRRHKSTKPGQWVHSDGTHTIEDYNHDCDNPSCAWDKY